MQTSNSSHTNCDCKNEILLLVVVVDEKKSMLVQTSVPFLHTIIHIIMSLSLISNFQILSLFRLCNLLPILFRDVLQKLSTIVGLRSAIGKAADLHTKVELQRNEAVRVYKECSKEGK
jgi:hypothetical protein